jgi:hypothetical protein
LGIFAPEIGLVIRHGYLWWNEARAGREQGVKDRPCVVIHLSENEHHETEVYISPITHTPPETPERALEIPTATKSRLRLDSPASWIITTELNRFIWPGPDLRTVPGGGLAYGLLPAAMVRDLILHIKANARELSLQVVGRDDPALLETVRRQRKPSTAKPRRK